MRSKLAPTAPTAFTAVAAKAIRTRRAAPPQWADPLHGVRPERVISGFCMLPDHPLLHGTGKRNGCQVTFWGHV